MLYVGNAWNRRDTNKKVGNNRVWQILKINRINPHNFFFLQSRFETWIAISNKDTKYKERCKDSFFLSLSLYFSLLFYTWHWTYISPRVSNVRVQVNSPKHSLYAALFIGFICFIWLFWVQQRFSPEHEHVCVCNFGKRS